MSAARDGYRLDGRIERVLLAITGAGALGFVLGAFLAPARAWAGMLVGFHLVLGLALAGGVFVALLACARARWSDPLLRVPEAMSAAVPVAGVAALVLLFGLPSVFEWATPHGEHAARPDVRGSWFRPSWFAARTVACFALWIWAARGLRNAPPGAGRVRRGAAFMAVFGVSYSVVSVDWMQSLEPHWASTATALVALAGLALSGVAAAIVLCVHLRRQGAWAGRLDTGRVQDLGKILFGFSLFWSYVHYSQYMLIWYTNLPEETPWYERRLEGMWWSTGVLSFVLNGAVPFALLLFRRVRSSETALFRIAGLVLVGRVADLFFQAGPPLLGGPSPWPSPWEALPVAGMAALWTLVVLRWIAHAPPSSTESHAGATA